ncbi:MAG: tetratricopeptide repeat protein [Candidatus Eisenbacteria bacterium]|nr:tetratricopeptide repeat protein [Candidatus Eisenbacteria bacterium]
MSGGFGWSEARRPRGAMAGVWRSERRWVWRGFLSAAVLVFGVAGATLTPRFAAAQSEANADEASEETALRAKIAADPEDVEAHFDLGNFYYNLGRRPQAEAEYRRILEIDPKHLGATINLGVVLNESGKSEEALVAFDQALELDPGNSHVLCNRGQALYALRRYDEALALYEEAAQRDPESQLAVYLIGVSFADAGIYKEAIREWEKVIAIDPDSETAATAREGIQVLRTLVGIGGPGTDSK